MSVSRLKPVFITTVSDRGVFVSWGVSGWGVKLILPNQDPLYLESASNRIVTLKKMCVL